MEHRSEQIRNLYREILESLPLPFASELLAESLSSGTFFSPRVQGLHPELDSAIRSLRQLEKELNTLPEKQRDGLVLTLVKTARQMQATWKKRARQSLRNKRIVRTIPGGEENGPVDIRFDREIFPGTWGTGNLGALSRAARSDTFTGGNPGILSGRFGSKKNSDVIRSVPENRKKQIGAGNTGA